MEFDSPRRSQPRCAWGDGQMGAWRAQTRLWQWITRARGGSGLAPCLACEFSPTANIADTFLQPVSPGIKADNIYAVFHLFASEVPRFRIPGSRFRFRELPPAIKVVTDRYKVPGSGSITQRGTLTGPGMATYLCRLTGMMVTARVADFGLGPSVPPTGPSKLRLQAGKFWRFWGAETPISQKRRP